MIGGVTRHKLPQLSGVPHLHETGPENYSHLSLRGTFETGTKCPFKSDVRLIESQIKRVT